MWSKGWPSTVILTGMLPFESTGEQDVVKIAEAYPKLFILGGINKKKIAEGELAIKTELARVLPAMRKRGGDCVSLDHWVPPEIGLSDFLFYVDHSKKVWNNTR